MPGPARRVLIAWELGANYGHLARCLAIARLLRERGHQVAFAVRDTRGAAELLSAAGFAYLQAALPVRAGRLARPPANYSEMLLGQGYAERLSLKGLVSAWVELIRLTRADVVLADHAPTALVAARAARVPAVAIGNGFAVPPPLSPLPSIRPWEAVSEERLRVADRLVNEAIGQVLGDFGIPAVGVAELFGAGALLDVFPEFDHFGERPGGNYIGPLFALSGADDVSWRLRSAARIVAYLRREVAGFGPLLHALQACDAEVLAVVPGLPREQAQRLATPRLRVATRPVAFAGLLPEADLMVGYGGGGSMAESLLAGVPLLMVPCYVEQHLASLRVEALGAGLSIGTDRRQEVFADAIGRLLAEPGFKESARRFAAKYAPYRPQSAAMKAVAAVEAAGTGDRPHPLNG